MATIVSEIVTVKISRIVKTGAGTPDTLVTPDIMQTIEMMSEQLFGEGAVVEVSYDPQA